MSIKLKNSESFVLALIQNRTVEEPISSTEMTKTLNCCDSDIRKYVNHLRLKKIPICSTRRGYFMAQNNLQLMEYLASLSSRINEIEKTKKSLETINDISKWHDEIEFDESYLMTKDNEQLTLI